MLKRSLLVVSLLLAGRALPLHSAHADQPAAEVPFVAAASRGGEYVKILPALRTWRKNELVEKRSASVTAYRLKSNGETQVLWESLGWYSFEVYLANGGEYLVRIGPWAKDQEHHTDLAVAFYRKGKLLRAYKVSELLCDQSKAVNSVSHYEWRPETQSRPTGIAHPETTFHLVMVDKTAYDFDLATGEVRRTYTDAGARSSQELFAAERREQTIRGEALWAESPSREAFEENFTCSEMLARAYYGAVAGEGSSSTFWSATLTPRLPLAQPTEIELQVTVEEGVPVPIMLSPTEIRSALERVLAHPFISARFTAGQANRFRARISGDRLHRGISGLRTFLEKAQQKNLRPGTEYEWIEVILDPPNPTYFTCNVNVRTGELYYEDTTKWPRVEVLLDAQGNPLATTSR